MSSWMDGHHRGEASVTGGGAMGGLPRHVCLEEGTLSECLYVVLSPHAEKVVVAAVSESRGSKDDRRDAFGLAEG